MTDDELRLEIVALRRALDEAFALLAAESFRAQSLENAKYAAEQSLADMSIRAEAAEAEENDLRRALQDVAKAQSKDPPLLQCVDCRNTESCAGAMARAFNRGRCLRCGGFFKVVRA